MFSRLVGMLCAAWVIGACWASPTAFAQQNLTRDAQGWTILRPAADALICYISSVDGDDATGRPVGCDELLVGRDPASPAGRVPAFKTIRAAMEKARDGKPDWVLLKRGDSWAESLPVKSGRSAAQRFVIGSYGADERRPVLKFGSTTGLSIRDVQFLVLSGLEFYAHTHDPNSRDYAGPKAIGAVKMSYLREGQFLRSVLMEDCAVRWSSYAISLDNVAGEVSDVVLRRNLFLDAFGEGSKAQGLWSTGATGLVLEENIFDHNGWLVQDSPERARRKEPGRATMLSHNTYLADCRDVVFRGNMFLRASSIGTKWTSNTPGKPVVNVLLDDNLFVEGEIGISMGGNVKGPARWKDCQITNNVMVNIGRGRPTGRHLAWYIELSDWDGGRVAGNLLVRQDQDDLPSTYGIRVAGQSARNIRIEDNTVHGLKTALALVMLSCDGPVENVVFQGNHLQSPGASSRLILTETSLKGFVFKDNLCFSSRNAAEWFVRIDPKADFARRMRELDRMGRMTTAPAGVAVPEVEVGWDAWVHQSGETGAQRKIDYPEPARSIESYNASLGGKPTLDDFVAQVRHQSRKNWRTQYTAQAVNEYMRAGFAMKKTLVTWRPSASTRPATRPATMRD